MSCERAIKVYFLIRTLTFSMYAAVFPPGVTGIAYYDYFKEDLPPKSRGVYKIFSRNTEIKYIGSAEDINKRLSAHCTSGIIQRGDTIQAIIFNDRVRQIEILNYEKFLITVCMPRRNKIVGAPARPWRSEQVLKLHNFYENNLHRLTPKGDLLLCRILTGQKIYENKRMGKSLFRVMRLFR